MCGAIPPLPQNVFMVWCSVKKSTGTTLPLLLPPKWSLPFRFSGKNSACIFHLRHVSHILRYVDSLCDKLQK
jgi:hypothetical protein